MVLVAALSSNAATTALVICWCNLHCTVRYVQGRHLVVQVGLVPTTEMIQALIHDSVQSPSNVSVSPSKGSKVLKKIFSTHRIVLKLLRDSAGDSFRFLLWGTKFHSWGSALLEMKEFRIKTIVCSVQCAGYPKMVYAVWEKERLSMWSGQRKGRATHCRIRIRWEYQKFSALIHQKCSGENPFNSRSAWATNKKQREREKNMKEPLYCHYIVAIITIFIRNRFAAAATIRYRNAKCFWHQNRSLARKTVIDNFECICLITCWRRTIRIEQKNIEAVAISVRTLLASVMHEKRIKIDFVIIL